MKAEHVEEGEEAHLRYALSLCYADLGRMMRNIKLVIEYDGTNYQGWQVQPKGPTIQGDA